MSKRPQFYCGMILCYYCEVCNKTCLPTSVVRRGLHFCSSDCADVWKVTRLLKCMEGV